MRTKLEINHMPRELEIGYIGETKFRTFEINMAAWLREMPDGQASIICIRPGETEDDAYITLTLMEDGVLYWTPTDADLGEHEGYGEIQIWLEETEEGTTTKRGKSVRVKTRVNYAIASASGTVPSGQESWMETMTNLKNQTVEAAEDAEEAKDAAEAAQAAAEEAQAAAEAAADDAETAQAAAETAQADAETAATAAGQADESAAQSASAAADSATTASTAATNAASANTAAQGAKTDAVSAKEAAQAASTAAIAAKDDAVAARTAAESAASTASGAAANAADAATSAAGSATAAAGSATDAATSATAAAGSAETAAAIKDEIGAAIAQEPDLVAHEAEAFKRMIGSQNMLPIESYTDEIGGETVTVYPWGLTFGELEEDDAYVLQNLKAGDVIAVKPAEDFLAPEWYESEPIYDIYIDVYLEYRYAVVRPGRPTTTYHKGIRVGNMAQIRYKTGTKLFEQGRDYLLRVTGETDEASRMIADILDWSTAETDLAKNAALEAEKITYGTENGVPVPSTDQHYENNAEFHANRAKDEADRAETLVGDLAKEETLQEIESETEQSVGLLEQILEAGHSSGDLNGYSLAPGSGGEVILSYTDPETEETSSVVMITETTGAAIAEALAEEAEMWRGAVENAG